MLPPLLTTLFRIGSPLSKFIWGDGNTKSLPTNPMFPTPPTFTDICFLGKRVLIIILIPLSPSITPELSFAFAASSNKLTTSFNVNPSRGAISGILIDWSFCITPVFAPIPPGPLGAPADPLVLCIHSGFGTGRLS